MSFGVILIVQISLLLKKGKRFFLLNGFPMLLSVQAAELPALPDMELLLEIVINGKPTSKVVNVNYHDGHYYLPANVLADVGLPAPDVGDEEVAVDSLPSMHVAYDSGSQQLLIDIPNDWLPKQTINAYTERDAVDINSSSGFLMNYNLYASRTDNRKNRGILSLYSEQRIFNPLGIFSNQGVYNYSFNQQRDRENEYIRYETNWRYNDESNMVQYMAGDVVSDSLPWTGSVRVGGIKISRNFSVRPDLITYPLAQFAGQAAIPSAVEVYINNYKNAEALVDPGPFTINSMPYVNGAGEATVITTDMQGRQVSVSVPFYVTSDLLREGLVDFSTSIGVIRQDYALNSFSYGELAANGIIRYGLTNWLTLEGRAEGGNDLVVGGVGSAIRLAQLGVLSGSYSHSKAKQAAFEIKEGEDPLAERMVGQQGSLGYTYDGRWFSINARRLIRSRDYGDLSNYKAHYGLSRRSDQLTGSLNLGQFGNIGAGYFSIQNHELERTQLVNFSYSKSLWRNMSFYAAMNREIGGDGYSAQMTFSIPLNSSHNASFSAFRDVQRNWVYQTSYNHTVPSNGGWGWDLSYADGNAKDTSYKQAGVIWKTPYAQSRVGVYGEKDYTYWGELSGSMVVMDNQFYATNTVSDSFVLVSTNGYSDIPVRYENQLIGRTNQFGYLLIPSVISYYAGNYEIDTLNLNYDVEVLESRKRTAVRKGSGYVMAFSIERVVAVSTRLFDETGNVIPAGSLVHLNDLKTPQYVGIGGALYLNNVRKNNAIRVVMADGRVCRSAFTLDTVEGIQAIADLTCMSDKNAN